MKTQGVDFLSNIAVDQILELGLVMDCYVKRSCCPALTFAKRHTLCVFARIFGRCVVCCELRAKGQSTEYMPHWGAVDAKCNDVNLGDECPNSYFRWRNIFFKKTGAMKSIISWYKPNLFKSIFAGYNISKKAIFLAYGRRQRLATILGVTLECA